MRARPIAVLGGVFAAAALTSLFVVRQLPREGDVTPMSAAPAPAPAPATSPPVEPPATEAEGLVEVLATAGGEPLGGAEVSLYLALPASDGAVAWRRAGDARSGKDGVARLPARPGRYLAAARAAGLAPGRAEVVRTRGEEAARVEVALTPVATLAGRVTARADGRPVAARIALVPSAAGGGGPAAEAPPEEITTAVAGADGAFALEGLAPGLHALRVEADGFHAALLPRVAVPRAAPVEVALERLGLVAGEVRRADGRPAAGAVVRATSREHSAEGGAAADGTFSLALPAGEYLLLASDGSAAGALAASVAPGAAVRGLALALRPGAAIEGEVRAASGAPAAGAVVTVAPHETARPLARAVAGTDGAFRFEGLAPGAWDVSAELAGASPARAPGLSVASGDRLRVRLALEPLGAIEGEVRDAAGRPLARARVRVTARGDGLATAAPLEARTDFEGRYRLEGVEVGRAELLALEDGASIGDARAVRVQPGRASRADFLLPASGVIAGRATRGGGPPPLGTAIVAVPLRAGAGGLQLARALADASGNYRLAVPAGEYRIHAAPAEAGPADLRVAPAFVRVEPGRSLRLDLAVVEVAAGSGLEVVVLEPGGAPSPGAIVTLARPGDGKVALAASADEEGRVRLGGDLGLAGREVTVRARNGGRSGEVTRALPASGSIAVRLAPGAALEGLVRAEGRAVRGFTVEVASQPARDGWRTLDVHRFAGDRFELGDLPAEPLRLTVRSDDGRRGAAELTPAAGKLEALDIALDGASPRR